MLRFKLAGHVGNAIEPHAKLPEAPFAPGSYANDEKRKANENLWKSLLAQAESRRLSQRRGQRFEALEAIRKAAALPVPAGHSRAELRDAALASLVLVDLETEREWEGDRD